MNNFNIVPNEILMYIYSYIPLCWPILRKVDSRWRCLLTNEYVDIKECINYAAAAGMKVYLGSILHSEIMYCLTHSQLDTLLHAQYTWIADMKHVGFLCNVRRICKMNSNEISNYTDCFANSLVLRLISKCANPNDEDASLARMVIFINDVYLLEEARKIGISFNKCTVWIARNLEVMKKLYEFGCEVPSNILRNIVLYRYYNNTGSDHANYESMFNFVISTGHKITNKDIICAIGCNDRTILKLIHGTGCKSPLIDKYFDDH